MKSANGRRGIFLLVTLGIFTAALVFFFVNRSMRISEKVGGEMEREVWPVDVVTVKTEPFVEKVRATGTLEPMENATLNAEISARIVAVRADLGDTVRQGQPLVILDQTAYALAQKNAEAMLASAKASANLAKDNYERAEKLVKLGHITQVQLEEMRTAHDGAQAGLRQAEVALDVARRNMYETVIRAPFAGRVSARIRSLGELVAPGTPIITVVRDGVLKIDVALSEMEITDVAADMPAAIEVAALQNKMFIGKVTRIGAAADRSSGSFPVRVEIDNRDGELMAGMRAAVSIELENIPEAIIVMRDQIVTVGEADAVFVIGEQEGRKTALARPVKQGARDGQRVQVLEGLQQGDLQVVVGQRSLSDGSPVHIIHIDGERVTEPGAQTTDTPATEG